MEVKMQTSFIPKKPIIESRSAGSSISLFLLISIIIFIVTMAAASGVWLWRESLVKKVDKDVADLEAAKKTYIDNTINDLIRLNDRIEVSKSLLQKHLAVSPVFTLLEKNVLRFVRLKSMKFSYAGRDKIKIDLSGTADSYDVLSKQSDAFGDESLRDLISQPVISDFNPITEGGVSFNFSASVYPKLVTYDGIANTAEGTIIDINSASSTTQ